MYLSHQTYDNPNGKTHDYSNREIFKNFYNKGELILLMFYKRYCDVKRYSVCKSAIEFHIPKPGKYIIKYT